MKSKLPWLVLLVFAVAWPPIYSLSFDQGFRLWLRRQGRMEDSDLHLLLNAKRWVVDIPQEKDGWFLALETESEGAVERSGGATVIGGQRYVVLTRRNKEAKNIDYAWYSMDGRQSATGGGIRDPLIDAGSIATRPDSSVQIGQPIYKGSKSQVQVLPYDSGADYEVRIVLFGPGKAELSNAADSR